MDTHIVRVGLNEEDSPEAYNLTAEEMMRGLIEYRCISAWKVALAFAVTSLQILDLDPDSPPCVKAWAHKCGLIGHEEFTRAVEELPPN